MRSPSKILATAALAVAVVIAACGGPSDSPPGPLAQRFDDMYIAAVPLEQKQAVVQSQNDWSLAKMENAKAEADLNEASTQLSIANNNLKAARLGVDSAVSNKKAADASADTNRMNQAARDLHAAESAVKAAEAHVRYFEAYRDYLKTTHRHAQENMYWREAQYELAKAQVGQRNNIAPKGVAYDTFSSQEQARGKRTTSSKERVDASRQRAMTARDTWLRAQEASDRENGRSSNLVDPMGPRAASASQ